MLNILVVEPNSPERDRLCTELAANFRSVVVPVPTDMLAVQAMDTRHFDIALIDVAAPVTTEISLAEIAANENTPVMLMAAQRSAIDLLRICAFPHVAKPISAIMLADEASGILRDAAQNIRRLRASIAMAWTRTEALKVTMAASARLLEEIRSRQSRAGNAEASAGARRVRS